MVVIGSSLSFLIFPFILIIFVNFLLLLIGINSTHSTESYVKFLDNLNFKKPNRTSLDGRMFSFGQLSNYPISNLAQLYPITMITVIVYIWYFGSYGYRILRYQLKNKSLKTFLCAKRKFERSMSRQKCSMPKYINRPGWPIQRRPRTLFVFYFAFFWFHHKNLLINTIKVILIIMRISVEEAVFCRKPLNFYFRK